MARFYVGQRVRVVVTYYKHGNKGKERIVQDILDGDEFTYTGCHRIGNENVIWFGDLLWGWEHQYEPITDPGREVIAWSECVWKPEHLRTEA